MVTRSALITGGVIVAVVISLASSASVMLGMGCAYNADCSPIVNSYCAEDVCKCQLTFVPSANRDKCLHTVQLSGDSCEDDTQCALPGGASSCRANQCLSCNASSYEEYSKCGDRYGCAHHEFNNKCWINRDIGQECSTSEECWLYPNSNMTRKCEGYCVCAQNYMYSPLPNPDRVDMCLDTNAGLSNQLAVRTWRSLLVMLGSVVMTTTVL